jgi:hypothetical protein
MVGEVLQCWSSCCTTTFTAIIINNEEEGYSSFFQAISCSNCRNSRHYYFCFVFCSTTAFQASKKIKNKREETFIYFADRPTGNATPEFYCVCPSFRRHHFQLFCEIQFVRTLGVNNG